MPPSTEFYRSLLDQCSDEVLVLDAQWRAVYFNQRCAHSFWAHEGTELHEGMDVMAGLPASRQAFWAELLNKVLAGKTIKQEFEYGTTRKRTVFRAKLKPLLELGQVVGVILFAKDITKRRSIERALYTSEQRYRSLFEKAPVGIAIVDSDDKVLVCNQMTKNILGFSPQEYNGQDMARLVHPDCAKQRAGLLRQLRDCEIDSFYHEERHLCKDGSYKWLGVYVNSVYSRHDNQLHRFHFFYDIDFKRHTEQELRQLNRDKDQVLAVVAHDLKDYIGQVGGLSEVIDIEMQQSAQCGMPPAVAEYTNLIRLSCENAKNIIQDLMEAAQWESGQPLALATEPVDFDRFVASVIRLQQLKAQHKSIRFQYLPTEPGLVVQLNPAKFSRVVGNLIGNAIKFSYESSRIELATYFDGGRFVLRITDFGIGIPAHLQPDLFKKFTKARRKGTKGEHSTGLGMYIVKNIVETHGGSIWLQSQEKLGTSVFIALPERAVRLPEAFYGGPEQTEW
jgi:two-component system, OmpR family, sensor histidine kinase VicK